MRLAKYLAHSGIASRRQAEELIAEGRVRINGVEVREITTPINPQTDCIEFDGRLVGVEAAVYVLLNKPAGFISAVRDPQGRSTVIELLRDIKERIYPVGRLDYDTKGLLLLTNDGEFTNLIIHPRYKIDKKYEVVIEGYVNSEDLRRLREGVMLEDGITAPAQVSLIKRDNRSSTIELSIHEGRKRQVKRMCTAIGHPVKSLSRIALGFLSLDGVEPGDYRFLSPDEVDQLKAMAAGNLSTS